MEMRRSERYPVRKKEKNSSWYAGELIESVRFKQENVYCQIISLIIQLNKAVGRQPVEAFTHYPDLLYSMLALLASLNLVVKFASRQRVLASGWLVWGVNHLLADGERIRDPELKPYIHISEIEFTENKKTETWMEKIKQKVISDKDVTKEEIEMLRC